MHVHKHLNFIFTLALDTAIPSWDSFEPTCQASWSLSAFGLADGVGGWVDRVGAPGERFPTRSCSILFGQ